jgi:hypothetical protein
VRCKEVVFELREVVFELKVLNRQYRAREVLRILCNAVKLG